MGSNQTSKKRGRNEKKNKVEIKKIKIKRTYKNENKSQQTLLHFFSFLFCTLFYFSFYTLFHFLIFPLFLFFYFFFFFSLFFFFFQQIKRKWNDKNKGTYMKIKIKMPHTCLKFTPKTISKPLFSLKCRTNMVFQFLACNELQNERRS